MTSRDAPWGRLYRGDLKSGFAYPVRAAEVADALRAARAEIGSLSFIVDRSQGRSGEGSLPGALLVYADYQERRDLPFQDGGGSLAVYGVAAGRRAEIHALLVDEALPVVAGWLAAAMARDETWREMRHERRVVLGQGGLSIEDREGGHWSTMGRS